MSEKPAKTKSKKATAASSEGGDKVHKLSLKGSSKMVAEFFEYSINTILFQRGVYPADDFTQVKKYGLNMLVNSDEQVKAYIKKIMSQVSSWMLHGKISKFVVVISDKDSGDKLERWQFDVEILQSKRSRDKKAGSSSKDKENVGPDSQSQPAPDKTEKEIQEEIQSIIRQITASVTFLPMLNGNCTFNVLVYADGDAEVPLEWGDGLDESLQGAEQVQLRSWSSSSHRVDTLVSYRLQD